MTARHKRTLTSHRWFPAFVALWFAALFGLVSLALPPALLERLVLALGLDRVIAAAAPPLGETARLLIAAGMSTVGEILGLLVGRGLAARRRPRAATQPTEAPDEILTRRARDAHPDAPPRKPVSAAEDFAVPLRTNPIGRATEPLESARAVTTDIASAPLDTLGVVQLSERLALALQARRPEARFAEGPDGAARITALASLQRISGAR